MNYLRLQGTTFLGAVKRISNRLPEGGRALVVSHGGILEAAALLGCVRYYLEEIGGEIGFCEGVAFVFEKEVLKGVEIKRLPKTRVT